jgi:hypothetical protein
MFGLVIENTIFACNDCRVIFTENVKKKKVCGTTNLVSIE